MDESKWFATEKERFRKELEDNKLKQEETMKTHNDAYSKLTTYLELRTIELKNKKEVIKEMTDFQRENKLKPEETLMEQSAFKDLEGKHKTEMLSKEMQIGKKKNDLKTIRTNYGILKEEAEIMKVDFRKQQEVLEKIVNLKDEISNKNNLFEAQTQAFKASELAHERAKEYHIKSDVQLSQLKEEMLLNQKNLEQSMKEIKLKDLTIQQYLQRNREK